MHAPWPSVQVQLLMDDVAGALATAQRITELDPYHPCAAQNGLPLQLLAQVDPLQVSQPASQQLALAHPVSDCQAASGSVSQPAR